MVSLELVLTLPILGVVLMGMVEFAMLFYARSSLVEASRAGARAASFAGVDLDQAEAEVRKILSPGLRQNVRVNVTPGVHTGDTVVVAVQVPMSAASPDLLWPIGFSLQDRYLYSETRMLKE
jgi:hypothetical protein